MIQKSVAYNLRDCTMEHFQLHKHLIVEVHGHTNTRIQR